MKKPINIALYFAVFLWMAVIFSFSAQSGMEVENLIGPIIRKIVEIIAPEFVQMPLARQEVITSIFLLIASKAAHIIIYLVLGALCTLALYRSPRVTNGHLFKALAICITYAVTDEFHQLFVSGRSGRFFDIGFDFFGALIGILLVILTRSIRSHQSVERELNAKNLT